MTDRFDHDELPLPPELAALDRELRSISYEERPSFGPELEAELEAEWEEVRHERPPRVPARSLMAAGVAGLLMVGLGVPSARASLARLVEALDRPAVTGEVVPTPPAGSSLFYEVPAAPLGEGAEPALLAPGASFAPPPAPEREPRSAYAGPEATLPRLLDREAQQRAIARSYPPSLLDAGIGGTVGLQLWVDSTGTVEVAHVSRSSGHAGLDRAALEVAPTFRFEPARRLGQPVGTWVEFPMVFEPVLPDGPARRLLPERVPAGELQPVDASLEGWDGGPLVRMPGRAEAEELLRAALAGDARGPELGSLEAILQGNPPPGRPPTAWRAAVTDALEAALERDPDNPAPLLALARIRRKQGLPEEARALVERALDRATDRAATVSPSLRADLHYERGTLLEERWRSVRGLGWVPSDSLPGTACPAARSAAPEETGPRVPVARLIAWNYLCPERLDAVLASSFEAGEPDGDVRGEMVEAFRRAVRDEPAHTPARMEILLALADEESWEALAVAARSEARVQGRLLRALAEHRLGRSAEAAEGFRRALARLVPESAERLLDVTPLLGPDELVAYRATTGPEREAWRARFWAGLDPVLGTEVNERRVEHLARATYAELGLGGVDTDAGRVWLRYGDPDAIRVFHEGPGLRTEFWDYGQGPDLTFRRLASSGKRDLTSEGRAYVDELMNVFPHRYGPRGRDVYALDGEVTRFRAEDGSGTALELRARVPSLFATGGRDSVDVGVFLMDEAGGVLTRARRRIATAERAVFFRIAAPESARTAVLEFLDPVDGRAASLRAEVAREGSDGGPAISDLLMTLPAAPGPDAVRRDAPWIRPLEPGSPVAGEAGAYFELYDVDESTAWYRVRAEAESLESGERRVLPVRPAGEDDHRASWDRLAETGGAAPEFLSLSLGALPPGRWIVRVVVDFPLAGGPLVAERRLTLG